MAGSYGHVTDDQGRLLQDEDICGMLECSSGDVAEAVEEMYGMIWVLAAMTTTSQVSTMTTAEAVEYARQNYKYGLELSPGRRQEGLPVDE